MSKKWYDVFGDIVKSIVSWFGSKEGQDTVRFIIEMAMIIIRGTGKFNARPTGTELRQYTRGVAKFYKYVSQEEIDRLAELKRTGAFDNLTSYDMDILLGSLTAYHCQVEASGEEVDADGIVAYLKNQF